MALVTLPRSSDRRAGHRDPAAGATTDTAPHRRRVSSGAGLVEGGGAAGCNEMQSGLIVLAQLAVLGTAAHLTYYLVRDVDDGGRTPLRSAA